MITTLAAHAEAMLGKIDVDHSGPRRVGRLASMTG